MTDAQLELKETDIPPAEFNKDILFGSIKAGMKGYSSADLWKIPVEELDDLKIMPDLNVRIPGPALTAHIRFLADSMKDGGYIMAEPLEVFVVEEDGKLVKYVSDGHCRLAALKLAVSEGAKIEAASAVTLPSKGKDIKDIVLGIIRHNSGKAHTPYEKAILCKRLFSYGMSIEEIAKQSGVTPEYVNLLLEAVSLPLSIVTMIQNEEVALNTAVVMVRKHGLKAVELLKQGLVASKAAGKTKVTAAYVPGATRAKVVKRQAEGLFTLTENVSKDPAFSMLSEENQKAIKEMLAQVAEKEKKAEAKAQRVAEAAAKNSDQQTENKGE